jgi:hypothetical protein
MKSRVQVWAFAESPPKEIFSTFFSWSCNSLNVANHVKTNGKRRRFWKEYRFAIINRRNCCRPFWKLSCRKNLAAKIFQIFMSRSFLILILVHFYRNILLRYQDKTVQVVISFSNTFYDLTSRATRDHAMLPHLFHVNVNCGQIIHAF